MKHTLSAKKARKIQKHNEKIKSNRIEKGCLRKTRYITGDKAKYIALKYNLGTYKCPDCGGWHLTSKT